MGRGEEREERQADEIEGPCPSPLPHRPHSTHFHCHCTYSPAYAMHIHSYGCLKFLIKNRLFPDRLPNYFRNVSWI